MLVLARAESERIKIGDDITITVTEINCRRKVVRIGIDAPAHIRVDREEVRREIDRVARESKEAGDE